jgi:hypothetical protein
LPLCGQHNFNSGRSSRRRVAALIGSALAVCLMAGASLAEDVPTPRISPIRPATAAEEALLATGATPPPAEEDFQPVQPLEASKPPPAST